MASPASSQRSGSAPLITVVAGTLLGAAFLLVARRATPVWTLFLTNLLAIQAGLTAFSDLFALIHLSSGLFSQTSNDAQSMAQITFVPALVWAALWALLAAALHRRVDLANLVVEKSRSR